MFEGVLTALIPPFSQGELDEKALRALVERQIEAGIDGLVPCGSTGESATLTHEEHGRVIEVVVDAARGRVPVVAGTGSNSTREAIAPSTPSCSLRSSPAGELCAPSRGRAGVVVAGAEAGGSGGG